jgi:glutathione S-transferase
MALGAASITAINKPSGRTTMANRFELHGIWLSGPTYKVALMLSLAGETFDFVHTTPREGAKAPTFVAKQRFGQVPLLVDRKSKRNLCQSASILEYLAGRLKKFGGASSKEKVEAREWMFWDFDRLAMHIYRLRGQRLGFRSISQSVAEMHYAEGNAALKVLDDHLKGRKWMVGEGLTIADIDIYGVVAYAPAGGFNLDAYANITAWIARLAKQKGFGAPDKLMAKG